VQLQHKGRAARLLAMHNPASYRRGWQLHVTAAAYKKHYRKTRPHSTFRSAHLVHATFRSAHLVEEFWRTGFPTNQHENLARDLPSKAEQTAGFETLLGM
jgi:hypothetical protein